MTARTDNRNRRGTTASAVLVLAAVVVAMSGLVIMAIHFLTEVDVLVLIADPIGEVGLAPYVGVFSHAGVLLLWSGATASLFAAVVTREQRRSTGLRRMLMLFGLLLAWLAIDDLFLIHEEIGLLLAEWIGRPEDRSLLESPVFLTYGVLWLGWLGRYRLQIFRTDWVLLIAGLAALAASIAIDVGEYVFPDIATATTWTATTLSIAEELAKLGGIILLCGYAMTTGRRLLNGRDGQQASVNDGEAPG